MFKSYMSKTPNSVLSSLQNGFELASSLTNFFALPLCYLDETTPVQEVADFYKSGDVVHVPIFLKFSR